MVQCGRHRDEGDHPVAALTDSGDLRLPCRGTWRDLGRVVVDDESRAWSPTPPPVDPVWAPSAQADAAAQFDVSAVATADKIAAESVEISAFDVETGRRLSELAAALRSPEGRMRWSEVDLRRVFSTERIALQQARKEVGSSQLGIIRKIDLIRNVLVLVPIFLTWFALAEASRAYARFIAANPDEISKPFLLLWENRFGGEASPLAPTFSFIALIDAVLLAIIIGLTLFSHGRREAREDEIEHRAVANVRRLDNLIGEASLILSLDKASRPSPIAVGAERIADRFDRTSQEVVTRLRVEQDRIEHLAATREREFSDFSVFASGLRAGGETIQQALVELRAVTVGLQAALGDLTSEVSVTTDQGRTLLLALQGLERLTSSNVQSDQALTRQIAIAAETLTDAAEKAIANADSAAQAGRVATDAGRAIAEVAQMITESQSRMEQTIRSANDANSRVAETLSAATIGMADIGRANNDYLTAIRTLMTQQETIGKNLTSIANQLGTLVSETAKRQEAASRENTETISRLGEVASQLDRLLRAGSSGGDRS